jgi:putative polyhydroxyalkanoate system protein
VADIHIVREHALGLPQARKLALRWAQVAEKKLDMECTYEEGKTADVVSFKRPGAHGELKVDKGRFELNARLGLLLGVFKGKIESAIVENLDQLLAHQDPLHAFEQGLAKHEKKPDEGAAKPHKAAAKPHKPATKAAAPKPAAGKPATRKA